MKELKLLKLVEILKDLKVTAFSDRVEIENEDMCLKAEIGSNGCIVYYVTGIYNSGADEREINMDALEELKAVAEKLKAVAEELAKEMGEEK